MLQRVIATLSWLSLGCPLECPPEARVGAAISDEQLDMQSILERHIKHFVSAPPLEAASLGRAEERFAQLLRLAQELPRDPNMASGVDLPEFVSALHAEFDPYGGRDSDIPRPQPPCELESRGSQHVSSAGVSSSGELGVCSTTGGARYKEVQADRIRWEHPPAFDAAQYLSDPVVKAAYNNPNVLRKPSHDWPKTRAAKVHCSRAELLKLAAKWDAVGALALTPCDAVEEREAVGVFAITKDREWDRLIINPTVINSRSNGYSNFTRYLAPGNLIGLTHLGDGECLRVSADDLSEMYYTFRVPPLRAARNAIRMKFAPWEVSHFRCFSAALHSVPVYLSLAALAMGDAMAVEIAQQSHYNVLATLAGSMRASEVAAYRMPYPRGDTAEYLAIDDHVVAQKVTRAELARGEPKRDSEIFSKAEGAYAEVGLVQHPRKRRRYQTSCICLGAEIDGIKGLVSAPRHRIAVLMTITAEVVRRGTCSGAFLASLLGLWIHVLMYRRPMLALLDCAFADSRRTPATSVFALSRNTLNELQALVILGPIVQTDMRVSFTPAAFCMDASPTGAGICAAPLPASVVAELWRHSEQKGYYTRLESPAAALLREKGLEPEAVFGAEPVEAPTAVFPLPPAMGEGVLYDTLECFSTGGTWAAAHAAAGLVAHPGIHTAGRPILFADLADCAVWSQLAALAARGIIREWHFEPAARATCTCTEPHLRAEGSFTGLRAQAVTDRCRPCVSAVFGREPVAGESLHSLASVTPVRLCQRLAAESAEAKRGFGRPLPLSAQMACARKLGLVCFDADENSPEDVAELRAFHDDPEWIGELADCLEFSEILRYRFARQGHINVQEANRSDGPSRGRSVAPPSKEWPVWLSELCEGKTYRFDVCLAAARVPKLAGRWLRLLLLLGGDIERHPGPVVREPRGPLDLSSGFAASTRHKMTKSLDAFKLWLAVSLNLSFSAAMSCAESAATALRAFGLHLYAEGHPRYLLVYAITAVQDAFPAFRNHLTPAWQIDKKWQHVEPGECRPVISKPILLASVSVGLLWGWFDWVAVTLVGFLCMLHPSELVCLQRSDLVLPEDMMSSDVLAYIHVRNPKTARFARRQHSRLEDAHTLRFLVARYQHLGLHERIFRGSLSTYRNQWNAIMSRLEVPHTQAQRGATPGVLRGSGATHLYMETEDVQLVAWRGRWSKLKTVEFYLQEVAAQLLLQQLPASSRERIATLSSFAGRTVEAERRLQHFYLELPWRADAGKKPTTTWDTLEKQELPWRADAGKKPTTTWDTLEKQAKRSGITLSFARKRSYKRALNRAEANGSAWYRGQWLSLATLRKSYVSNNAAAKTEVLNIPAASRSQCKSGSRFSLRAFSWNCGGLNNLKDELHTWLQEHGSDYSIVLLQETWYRSDMDFLDRGWICINSGVGEGVARAQAGVMVLLRKDVFDQSHVRFHHVVPGRVLHVQALCKGGWVNVVNIYQHSWGLASDQDRLLTKRAAIWEKVRDTFGQIPKGHFLIAGGDLNTSAKPMHPWIGRGMLQKGQISPDAECLEQLVQDFQLKAVNTFGRPTAFSYVHEGYKVHRKSFVDYWLLRQCQSGQSSASLLAGFEVGRWREGGRHLPIVVAVTLRPYHHQVRKTPREWPVWKCKLLQQAAKDHPEKAAEFQAMVQERLEAEIEYQPQFLNDILLQVGKQVFDIQRPRVQPPAWTADAHTNLIKQMWSHYRLMKRRRCLPGTRAILQAWRHQVAFLRLHRAVQKHSRQLRRSHFDQLLTAAERCDQVDGASTTFTLIKKWAPKQAKKRTQLRSPNGRLLCPAEEVKELATFWKEICAGSDGQAPPSHQPRHAYHVSREELLHALLSLKGNKAAPAHCAPHALWQIAAGPVAEFLDVQVLSKWRDEEAEVFEDWSASWLTFLNKANKPGNKPGDLRPISLLEPAGKAMSGIIKQHLMPFLQPWVEDRHLFGYLPNRSSQQALSIVYRHCADARARAKAQGRDLYAIRQGHRRGGCAGGLQVSIDFTQAFDRANRALLNSALLHLKVPDNLRCLIMQWVETTTFHVVQDDAEAKFSSSRGIRQGCRLSPSLWVCISVYLLHLLEQEMGSQWCNDHLVGFADDTHLRWDIHDAVQLHQALAQAHRALQLLEKAGLKLSRDKTVCLLRVEGVQTPHIKRQLIDKAKDGRVLKISPDYILPLKQDHIYLGACITYGDFEHKNMQHRVHAGKVAFQRVRKFLMADKAASMQKRLRLWKAIVIPTVMYSITASGVLPKGVDALRVMLTKQARAIARSPRHRLGGETGEEVITESDEVFWRKVAMVTPEQMVQQRLQAAVERTTELTHHLATQDVRISAAVREWEQTILQQFKDRCIQSDSVTTVHKCDVCNAEFGDYSSLRAHKAKVHSAERRQTAAPTFDRQRHGVDGMPTCSMCGHKFLRWADLQKHVAGNFCQQSTPDTEASTMVEAKASVWDQARDGTLQLDDISLATVTEELKQELLQHCALCRQWQPDPKYIKIHWGRVHKKEWQAHEAHTLQWRRATFARITGTCAWCHRSVPKGSVHTDTCPVLFQLSMVRAMGSAASGGDVTTVSAEPGLVAEVSLPDVHASKHWTTHCQLCHEQCTARGLRRHMEQHHANIWSQSKTGVVDLCSQWAASLKRPCQFCGGNFKRAAQHAHVCHVLFQSALQISLPAAPPVEVHGQHVDGGGPVHGHLRSDDAGASGNGSQKSRRAGRAERLQQEAASGSDQAYQGQRLGERPRQSLQQRLGEPLEHTGTGSGTIHGFFRRSSANDALGCSAAGSTGQRDSDAQDGQAVSATFRDGAPGNGSLVLGVGTGLEEGQGSPAPDGGQIVARNLDSVHDDGARRPLDEDACTRADQGQHDQAWLAHHSPRAASLAIHDLDGGEVGTRLHQSGDPSQRDDGDHKGDQAGALRQVRRTGAQVPQRAPVGGADGGRHITFSLVNQHERGSGGSDVRAFSKAGGQHGSKGRGRSPSGRTPQAATPGTSASGGHGAATGEFVTKTQRQVLGVRLQNNHNVCYINSLVLLWAWASSFSNNLEYFAGAATPALRAILTSKGLLNLLELLPWQCFYRGWPNLRLQHDVQEWCAHLFTQVMPRFLSGSWHAKLLSLELRDRAHTYSPVWMTLPSHVQECTLQTVVDQWSAQDAIHALCEPPEVLCVCLARFGYNGDEAFKHTMSVSLQSLSIMIPCFLNENSLETRSCSYTVIGAISHYGQTVNSGHYRAMLYSASESCWYITDDGSRAKRAKHSDMQHLFRNAYLIWLRAEG
ncbi:unnamed protein product [Symbiodinium sp. CCMP2592]|nr:unnamed protein product [Symbiodinium sp. CCMP2592]